jgi:hypothetical protein
MKVRVLLAVICASLLVVPAAFADTTPTMSLSGDVETNTDVTFFDDGATNYNAWSNAGRLNLTVEGRLDSDTGWFSYAKGNAMIDASGTTGVDDAYVEFGTESLSFLIGRYEAPSLFGKGQDTFIVSAPGAPTRYEANYARGRLPINNMALKFSGLEIGVILGGLEEGTIYGVTTDPDTGVTTPGVIEIPFDLNAYGARPVYTFSTDTLTLHVGGEYLAYLPQNTDDNDAEVSQYGGGMNIEAAVGASTLGASVAYGATTGKDQAGDDLLDSNTLSTMLYWTMPVGEADSFGLMGGYTALSVDKFTDDTMFEMFANYSHQLPVEGLMIKFAGSYAGASFDRDSGPDPDDSSAFGIRMRVNYDF